MAATNEPGPDFVFLDAANRPWRVVCRSSLIPMTEDSPGEFRIVPWVWYWHTYDRWVPLREATPAEIHCSNRLPQWQAELYHAVSELHS